MSSTLARKNMLGQILLLGIFLVLGVSIVSSQPCGRNERYTECVDFCNDCRSEERACDFPCIPGCDCVPGYTRDTRGRCIPRRECRGPDQPSPEFRTSQPRGKEGCPNGRACKQSCIKRGYFSGRCIGITGITCLCELPIPTKTPPPICVSTVTTDVPPKIPVPTAKTYVNTANPTVPTAKTYVPTAKTYFPTAKTYVPTAKTHVPSAKPTPNTAKTGVPTAKSDVPPATTTAGPPTQDVCPDEERCTAICLEFEYARGICIGPGKMSCSCDGFLTMTADSTAGCPGSGRQCVRSCRRRGFGSGSCVGTVCRCMTTVFCQVRDCHQRCVRRGFGFGACAGPDDVCRCFM